MFTGELGLVIVRSLTRACCGQWLRVGRFLTHVKCSAGGVGAGNGPPPHLRVLQPVASGGNVPHPRKVFPTYVTSSFDNVVIVSLPTAFPPLFVQPDAISIGGVVVELKAQLALCMVLRSAFVMADVLEANLDQLMSNRHVHEKVLNYLRSTGMVSIVKLAGLADN